MKARDIMSTEIHTLSPECTVGEALRQYARKKFQALPIVDGTGHLQGVISIMMIFKHILPPYIVSGELKEVSFAPDLNQVHDRLKSLRNQPVSHIMKHDPPTVSPDMSVLACGAILLQSQEHDRILPVIDKSGLLIGIIAPWDFLKSFGEQDAV